jgi:hypothetical protein
MPSHLSDIGFHVKSQQDFEQLALKACNNGHPFRTRDGTYIHWSVGLGIELWAQLNQANEIIGLQPHFRGEGRMRAGVVQEIKRPDGTVLDAGYYAWADPPEESIGDGIFPFVFDVPSYQLQDPGLGTVVVVQLAAFAHELESYKTVDEYERSQLDTPAFASQSFIPSGLFSPNGGDTVPPQAYAIFTGHVLEASLKTNPVSGNEFCWSLVSTLGGEVDVVADPALLNDMPVKGGVLKGSFWLSGVRID